MLAGAVPQQWIVGVRHHVGPGREPTHRRAEVRRDGLRLAEPVELVAEDVGEDEDPGAELGAARAAFSAGHLEAAITSASAAADDWTTAADRGRGRLISLGLAALALLLVGRMLMLHRWRRRSGSTTA